MLEPPKVGALARMQLAAWETIADGWPVSLDSRAGEQAVWRCGNCGNGVALATDSTGTAYQYTAIQWQAMIVLHLRNAHPALDPDKPL